MIPTDHTPLLASTATQSPNSRNFGSTDLKIIQLARQVIKNITAFIGKAATFCKRQLERLSTIIPSIFQQTQSVTTTQRPIQAVLEDNVVPSEGLFPPHENQVPVILPRSVNAETGENGAIISAQIPSYGSQPPEVADTPLLPVVPSEDLFPPQENQAPVTLPRSVTNAETGENGAIISLQIPSDESQPPEMADNPLLPNAGQMVPYIPSLYDQMAKMANERFNMLFRRSFELHKELSLPGQTTQLTSRSHEFPFQIPPNFCKDSIVLERNYGSPSDPKKRVNNFLLPSFYSKYFSFPRRAPYLMNSNCERF